MNKLKTLFLLSSIVLLLAACQNQVESNTEITYEKGAFGYDLEKL